MPNFIHEPFDFPELTVETFDNGERYYSKSGVFRLPSVTTVLSSLPKPQLEAWKARVGPVEANRVTKQAGSKGTGVHKVAERYVLNDPEATHGMMPTVVESFKKIRPAIDEHITKVNNNEFCLWSSRLKTAGRCDLLGEWDGNPAIIDFKTSNKPKKLEWIEGYFLQATCYAMMVAERVGLIVPKIVILIAVPDLFEPQIFVENVEDRIEDVWKVFKKYHEGIK